MSTLLSCKLACLRRFFLETDFLIWRYQNYLSLQLTMAKNNNILYLQNTYMQPPPNKGYLCLAPSVGDPRFY